MKLLARSYFLVQGLAGALWWVLVFTVPWVREVTLGDIDPLLMALLDVPLFVIASLVAASGRWPAVVVASVWTVLVSLGMMGYATLSGQAGAGAILMFGAAGCSTLALVVLRFGEIPSERLLLGPFRFREARGTSTAHHLLVSLLQMLVFWGVFLWVLPVVIASLERLWGLALAAPPWLSALGMGCFVLATALGVWSAVSMAISGQGTPLPAYTATKLVVRGPYRYVRNPMAVAGIAQGVAVGLILNSWLVVLYALSGSLIWNWLVRPHEEHDLEHRFGEDFLTYRDRTPLWVPRILPRRRSR